MDSIADKTFFTLCFYNSTTEYFEDGTLHFPDITNLDDLTLSLNASLDCKPMSKVVNNNCSQVVTNFEDEAIKKKNKYVAKKQAQLKNLCFLISNLALSYYLPVFIVSCTKSL